ncbi:MAG TPA: hypothetical protein VLG38_04270 [Gammaproteobacteria bacterium]|nr:hypothetical protein [Gammaproteobacteria bacterium]
MPFYRNTYRRRSIPEIAFDTLVDVVAITADVLEALLKTVVGIAIHLPMIMLELLSFGFLLTKEVIAALAYVAGGVLLYVMYAADFALNIINKPVLKFALNVKNFLGRYGVIPAILGEVIAGVTLAGWYLALGASLSLGSVYALAPTFLSASAAINFAGLAVSLSLTTFFWGISAAQLNYNIDSLTLNREVLARPGPVEIVTRGTVYATSIALDFSIKSIYLTMHYASEAFRFFKSQMPRGRRFEARTTPVTLFGPPLLWQHPRTVANFNGLAPLLGRRDPIILAPNRNAVIPTAALTPGTFNRFSREVQQAIDADNFSAVMNYCNHGGDEEWWISLNDQKRRELETSKFNAAVFWSGLAPHQRTTLQREHPEFFSYNDELMCVPFYLEKRGGRTYIDATKLILHLDNNDHTNPETRQPIATQRDIKFDKERYLAIKAAKQRLLGAAPALENEYETLIDRAITNNDFAPVKTFLLERGGQEPEWSTKFVNWGPALKDLVFNSKYSTSSYWDEHISPELREVLELANPELCCGIDLGLLIVPINWEKAEGAPAYFSFGGLLEYLQTNDRHPETRVRLESYDKIKFDQVIYQRIIKIIAATKAWHSATTTNNMPSLLEYLHANFAEKIRHADANTDCFDVNWVPKLQETTTKITNNTDDFFPGTMDATERTRFTTNNPTICCGITKQVMRHPVYITHGEERLNFDLMPLLNALRKSNKLPGTEIVLTSLNQVVYDADLKAQITAALNLPNATPVFTRLRRDSRVAVTDQTQDVPVAQIAQTTTNNPSGHRNTTRFRSGCILS